jgi:hypothetical protein
MSHALEKHHLPSRRWTRWSPILRRAVLAHLHYDFAASHHTCQRTMSQRQHIRRHPSQDARAFVTLVAKHIDDDMEARNAQPPSMPHLRTQRQGTLPAFP